MLITDEINIRFSLKAGVKKQLLFFMFVVINKIIKREKENYHETKLERNEEASGGY